jgi:hypothetical protein
MRRSAAAPCGSGSSRLRLEPIASVGSALGRHPYDTRKLHLPCRRPLSAPQLARLTAQIYTSCSGSSSRRRCLPLTRSSNSASVSVPGTFRRFPQTTPRRQLGQERNSSPRNFQNFFPGPAGAKIFPRGREPVDMGEPVSPPPPAFTRSGGIAPRRRPSATDGPDCFANRL